LTPQSAFAGDLSAFNASNNRLVASLYDAAGNQTSDAQNRTFAYDAENRQITFNGTAGQYFYDGDGRRVKKTDASGTTVFVYDVTGRMIAEYHSDPVPAPAGGGGTSYLTSDHLGSTRVVTKADGSVKARYDYLPFGEELGSGIGGRSTAQGYSQADGLRQKFTGYEHDDESGLDFAQARYYSSAQGRFTSTDPLLSSSDVGSPQSWNRYAYVLNNPLLYTDPLGLYVYDKSVTEEQRKQFDAALKRAKEEYLKKIEQKYGKDSKEYKKVERALNAYGDPGQKNGVTIFANNKVAHGQTDRKGSQINVSFNPKEFGNASLIGHEGSHVADAQEYIASGFKDEKNPTRYQHEFDGLFVQAVLGQAEYEVPGNTGGYFEVYTPGNKTHPSVSVRLWDQGWQEVDKARTENINKFLAIPKKEGGLYGLTPQSKEKRFTAPARRRR
jgi:RHS repeat-associated protein